MKLVHLIPSRLTSATLLLLVLALALISSLHSSPVERQGVQSNSQWRQPNAISSIFPEPLSTDEWQFDYDDIEQVLARIKQGESNNLIINETTAVILNEAVSNFSEETNENSLRRIRFLVSKGMRGDAGQELGEILVSFYRYKKAEAKEKLLEKTSQAKTKSLKVQETRFEQTLLIQERYLGPEVSEQLFGRKNALNRYLLARRRVSENASFTAIQKQKILGQLQQQFKSNVH